MNTPRWLGWVFKFFPGSIFRIPSPPPPLEVLGLSKNLVMIVNSGISIAGMFLKTIQVDYPIIVSGLGV